MHYSTLVLLPIGSTPEDVDQHLMPFYSQDDLPDDIEFNLGDYPNWAEYHEDVGYNFNPVAFWDWYQIAPHGRWGFPDFENEGKLTNESFLPCQFLAENKYAQSIGNELHYLRLYNKGEITSEEWQAVLDRELDWAFAPRHTEQRVVTAAYIVTPTGMLYYNTGDDYAPEWQDFCLSLYQQYPDCVAWLVDCHN